MARERSEAGACAGGVGPCGEGGKGWVALGRVGRKEGGDGLGRAGAWVGPVWAEGLVFWVGSGFFFWFFFLFLSF